jgi:hypothetical protein
MDQASHTGGSCHLEQQNGKFKQILKDPSPELKEELEKIQDRLDGLEKHILKGIMSAENRDSNG